MTMETVIVGVRIETGGLSEDARETLVNAASRKVEQYILEMAEANPRIRGYFLTSTDLSDWAAKIGRSALVRIHQASEQGTDTWKIAGDALCKIGPSPATPIANEPGEVASCGRCDAVVPVQEAERCWWCTRWMCFECWDKHGHCGHPEADEQNRQARAVNQPAPSKDGTE